MILDRSHQQKRDINLLLFGKFRTIGDTVPRRAGDLFIVVRIATYLIYFWRSGRGLDGDAALLPALLTFAGIRKSFLFFRTGGTHENVGFSPSDPQSGAGGGHASNETINSSLSEWGKIRCARKK